MASLSFGCGGSDGGGNGGGASNGGGLPTGDESLALTFSPMYSAFEPDHDYKVPVVAATMAKVKFRALDQSMVDVRRTGDQSAMLTMKKAGDTTIIAELEDGSGVWGRSELHIAAATPELWALGKERYENGIPAFVTPEGGFQLPEGGLMLPPGLMFVDGGLVIPDGGFGGFRFDGGMMFRADPMSACTFCHKPEGATGMGGGILANLDVEHTPQQIGGYSDEELINIFTMGMKPPGVPMRVAMGRLAQTWNTTHQWQMEEEAKAGIIVYIRSLEPKAQGEVDFLGGLFRGGDGGFMLPPGLFGDGGFNIGSLFGEGGIRLPPGLLGDAGTSPTPTQDAEAPAEDAGGTEADAGETMDAGAG